MCVPYPPPAAKPEDADHRFVPHAVFGHPHDRPIETEEAPIPQVQAGEIEPRLESAAYVEFVGQNRQRFGI